MWMEPLVVHDFDRIMNMRVFTSYTPILLYKNNGLLNETPYQDIMSIRCGLLRDNDLGFTDLFFKSLI